MSVALHPSAPHHLPSFITVPGETDGLMVAMVFILIGAILGIGVLYFKLHALPEHMAHKGEKVQFEVVAVLGLLALFTHNHLYWIAALLLALIRIPDFSSPLSSIAASLAAIAESKGPSSAAKSPSVPSRQTEKAKRTPSSAKTEDAQNG